MKTTLPGPSSRHARAVGRGRMESLSVAICCLARDAEQGLARNIPSVDRLAGLFKDARIIVVENDSKDRTKEILAAWTRANPSVTLLSRDTGGTTIPASVPSGKLPQYSLQRIGKMASFRNQYLDEIDRGKTPDILIALDIDVDSFDLDGICRAFGMEEPWDGAFANGRDHHVFYDTYALRETGDGGPKRLEDMNRNQVRWGALSRGSPPVPVLSAFGGLGIYRYGAIRGLRYRAEPNPDPASPVESLCEHDAFHADMRGRGFGRLFVLPFLPVAYQPFWKTKEKQRWFDAIVLDASRHEPWKVRLVFWLRNLRDHGPSASLGRFAITHLLLAPASLEDAIGRKATRLLAVFIAALAGAGTWLSLGGHASSMAVILGLLATLAAYPAAILGIRTAIRLSRWK